MNNHVCIIGAGISGICIAIQIIRKLGTRDFVLFEQNCDVGGSWLTFTYPGCETGVAGHQFYFSFEPKSDWERTYPSQSEILQYLRKVSNEYQLYQQIRFRKTVQQLIWLESHKKWKAVILDLDTSSVHELLFPIVIVAAGRLHPPVIPKEFVDYPAPVIHTSSWDDSLDLDGKTVAVVGSGSTAVQLTPHLIERVKTLILYQRSPAWILPKNQNENSPASQFCFKHVPGCRKGYRALLFLKSECAHYAFRSKLLGLIGSKQAKSFREANLRNPQLQASLMPVAKFGTKPPCFSDDYYLSLNATNVRVVPSRIFSITGKSILSEGGDLRKPDVVILATGYQTQEFASSMCIIGETYQNIAGVWNQKRPSGYGGSFFKSLPNMFFIKGPGTAQQEGTFVAELQSKMIIRVIREMKSRCSKRVSIKDSFVARCSRTSGNSSNRRGKKDIDWSIREQTLFSLWWNANNFNPSKMFDFV